MIKTNKSIDAEMMNAALSLARRGLGNTAPNPTVGCIVVRPDMGNRVVGRGWTQPGGRPHAETEAIKRAGALSSNATAYVTLEPCCHHGKTPPCTDAIIAANIKRVVIAAEDPDPRVAGSGVSTLREAGIEVTTGIHHDAANGINVGFLKRIKNNRPHITMKMATSLDARTATHSGHSQWITGQPARRYGHLLRAKNDAILTGMGTVRADNPTLTCRLPGLGDKSPVRVIMDPRLEVDTSSNLITTTNQTSLWFITGNGRAQRDTAQKLSERDADIQIFHMDLDEDGKLDVHAVSFLLAQQGINRVLLEAGAKLNASFIAAGLVDEIYWFRAPMIVGGDGYSCIGGVCVDQLIDAPGYSMDRGFDLGADRIERYVAKR